MFKPRLCPYTHTLSQTFGFEHFYFRVVFWEHTFILVENATNVEARIKTIIFKKKTRTINAKRRFRMSNMSFLFDLKRTNHLQNHFKSGQGDNLNCLESLDSRG